LISGGEFACTVRGDGRGGRNLETVLRCALAVAAHNEHIVVLSAGTDGIDGNSPAAGAVADEMTLNRATSLGLDASSFLERSDSFGFFERLGDAIITGPTSTNVRDVRVILKVSG
jgi:hydroxypyruvate reductase